MDLEEYNKRLGKVVNDLQNNMADTMIGIGAEAVRMIKERVIEKGIDAKGGKYRPYSTKPTLIGCKSFIQKGACDSVFGSKDKRKKLEWVTINGHKLAVLPGGYKKIREMQGRQTAHVDFTMTRNMWNDINIISREGNHRNGEVIIGARKESEKKKLAGNTASRGDILDLSPKEIYYLYKTYNLKTLQVFRNNGL